MRVPDPNTEHNYTQTGTRVCTCLNRSQNAALHAQESRGAQCWRAPLLCSPAASRHCRTCARCRSPNTSTSGCAPSLSPRPALGCCRSGTTLLVIGAVFAAPVPPALLLTAAAVAAPPLLPPSHAGPATAACASPPTPAPAAGARANAARNGGWLKVARTTRSAAWMTAEYSGPPRCRGTPSSGRRSASACTK